MSVKLKADVLQAIDHWNAGKPVRSIELGHIHRMQEHPGLSPRVDLSKRLHNDQERAHAYVFYLLQHFERIGVPQSHEEFIAIVNRDINVPSHLQIGPPTFELTQEEKNGAESLAWKALLVGWRKAIDGHREVDYIEVAKPKAAA